MYSNYSYSYQYEFLFLMLSNSLFLLLTTLCDNLLVMLLKTHDVTPMNVHIPFLQVK